jgi:hypothetical protein
MSIHIEGRRWFQKTYGNTYHSVRIHKDGEIVRVAPMSYGYGDQYLQTAHTLLQDLGVIPKTEGYQGTQYLRETLGVTWSVSDVGRQKDL